MVRIRAFALIAILSLLEALPLVSAHGHGDHAANEQGAPASTNTTASAMASAAATGPESYFAYKDMSAWMLGHIALMIIAWFFILPVGEQIL